VLKGTCRIRDLESPCFVKVAVTQDQLTDLTREMDVLNTIISRDVYQESQKFIARWLTPPQLMDDDRFYFIDELGDMVPHPMPLRGLVMECGGMNLKEFMDRHGRGISVGQRIEILSEVVEALQFLHQIGIVHCDLKPENIVSFTSSSSSRSGGGDGTKWKLVDFDSSVEDGSPFSSSAMQLTMEYTSPEIVNALALEVQDQRTTINWTRDIWSLGLIAFSLFTNQSFWTCLSPSSSSPFRVSLLHRLHQEEIDATLRRTLLCKEFSFVECCLKLNPQDRRRCRELLQRSLFSTSLSTVQVTTLRSENEVVVTKFEELKMLLETCLNQSQKELILKFDELSSFLKAQSERIIHLNNPQSSC
jgi:serine/threonine protein kinase